MLKKRRSQFGFRGLSLIELLVAIALSSLLIASVTGLLRTLVERRDALQQQEVMPMWKMLLQEQLRKDFELATKVDGSEGNIGLEGYLGADLETGELTMTKGRVEYLVRQLDGESLLFRRITNLESLSARNTRIELVGSGIARISLEPRLADDTEDVDGAVEQDAGFTGNSHLRYGPLALYDDDGIAVLRSLVRVK